LRIIAKRTLRDFWLQHPNTEQALRSWYKEASQSEWRSPAEIKSMYPAASVLTGGRVVFNIQGNRFRLIVRINYRFGIVWIRFIGDHTDYDRIDANTI
jgi:mRNA interferase HigB